MSQIEKHLPPPEQEYGRDCKFCEGQDDAFWQYHHSYCAKCSRAQRKQPATLCSVCQHLRIRHRFICARVDRDINLGSLAQLRERGSHCDFCQIVSKTLSDAVKLKGSTHAVINDDLCQVDLLPGGSLHMHVKHRETMITCVPISLDVGLPTENDMGGILRSLQKLELRKTYTLNQYVDWQRVCEWVKATPPIQPDNRRMAEWPRGMKVIDVKNRCVVDAPVGTSYIALSYVWGGIPIHQSASDRLDKTLLPATIRDAMIACERMAVPCLWVDQLCIDQRNNEEMKQQLNQMHLIYQWAKCTLVALSGDDSNYGLPGVTSSRNWDHTIVDIGDLTFMSESPSLSNLLTSSKWYTRGWTFQEMIFSPNLLFFTDYGAYYWNCSFVKAHEVRSESASGRLGTVGDLIPKITNFSTLLDGYTHRALTFDSDILRAFSAILQATHGDATYCGLPLSKIDEAIGWQYDRLHGSSSQRRRGFPSWSWASHNGIVWHSDSVAGLAHWITPSGVSCQPLINTSWRNDIKSSHFSTKDLMALLGVIWMEGCIEPPFPVQQGLNNTTFEELAKLWPTYDAFWFDVFASYESNDYLTQQHLDIASYAPDRILVRGQTAHFLVDFKQRERGLSQDTFTVRSRDGRRVGRVIIPVYNRLTLFGGLEEFLLLSVGSSDQYTGLLRSGDKASPVKKLLYFDEDGNVCPPGNPDHENSEIVLNVMLISGYQKNGVLRRLGIGQIYLKKWAEASREFKTIILE